MYSLLDMQLDDLFEEIWLELETGMEWMTIHVDGGDDT